MDTGGAGGGQYPYRTSKAALNMVILFPNLDGTYLVWEQICCSVKKTIFSFISLFYSALLETTFFSINDLATAVHGFLKIVSVTDLSIYD